MKEVKKTNWKTIAIVVSIIVGLIAVIAIYNGLFVEKKTYSRVPAKDINVDCKVLKGRMLVIIENNSNKDIDRISISNIYFYDENGAFAGSESIEEGESSVNSKNPIKPGDSKTIMKTVKGNYKRVVTSKIYCDAWDEVTSRGIDKYK